MPKLISRILFLALIVSGCSVIQTAGNISRLKFKIQSASDYRVAGVSVIDKKSIDDLTSVEALKITTAAMRGNVPITFILIVEAKNPNDGDSGFAAADLSIESFPWRLFINDKETITGNIIKPVFVPGKGVTAIIPLQIEFDVAKNIKEKNIDDIISFALQLSGIQNSTSNLKLLVKPIIGTPLGNIKYPEEITIVDETFN